MVVFQSRTVNFFKAGLSYERGKNFLPWVHGPEWTDKWKWCWRECIWGYGRVLQQDLQASRIKPVITMDPIRYGDQSGPGNSRKLLFLFYKKRVQSDEV